MRAGDGTIHRSVLRTAGFAVLAMALLQSAALACYSGLVLIPTTDVTGNLQCSLDLQWQGYSRVLKTDQLVINTEVGLGDRFEAGVDVDASPGHVERRVLLNGKYVFLKNGRFGFSAALGVQNMDSRFSPHPYAVCTKAWGAFRAHLGVLREQDGRGNHGFFGADWTVAERWQFMADHTAGPGNFSSAGVVWMGQGWQILAGAQWPNGGGRPLAVIHVILTGAFARR